MASRHRVSDKPWRHRSALLPMSVASHAFAAFVLAHGCPAGMVPRSCRTLPRRVAGHWVIAPFATSEWSRGFERRGAVPPVARGNLHMVSAPFAWGNVQRDYARVCSDKCAPPHKMLLVQFACAVCLGVVLTVNCNGGYHPCCGILHIADALAAAQARPPNLPNLAEVVVGGLGVRGVAWSCSGAGAKPRHRTRYTRSTAARLAAILRSTRGVSFFPWDHERKPNNQPKTNHGNNHICRLIAVHPLLVAHLATV